MEISDEMLIEEFKRRIDEKNRAIFDVKAATRCLEETNQKLQESERLKSSFLSNIRNEINNPLTTLVNFSGELVNMDLKDEDRVRRIATMLHSEAHNLDFQIRNILMAGDLEGGEAALHITKVDINSLIDECIEGFAPLISGSNIRVERNGPTPFWANTDSDKVSNIIINILSNGIMFNKDGGLLEISFGESGDEFFISVRDEGIGIEEKDFKVIFDRFKQLDSGSQKQYQGHGLGLSVAKAVADILGGTLSVESTPGKGSVFTLRVSAQNDMAVESVSTEGAEFFFDDDDDEEEF